MNDSYAQILNYTFMLRTLGDNAKRGIVINETVTSVHDTCRIGEMFHLLKHNYFKLYNADSFVFRLVISDLSWATIHAALEVLNSEDVIGYAKRVYDFADLKESTRAHTKSWLASCASHTMHRFTRILKKKRIKFPNSSSKTFAICCFSLLLNSLELESAKRIFGLMCRVFLDPMASQSSIEAKDSLLKLIAQRPKEAGEVLDAECEGEFEANDGDENLGENESDDELELEEDGWTREGQSIKAASPFTAFFLELEEQFRFNISNNSHNNPVYKPEYIAFLQSNFMPYIFVWGGFVFRGIDNMTRLTQGCIEKHFATCKRAIREPQVPAIYIREKYKMVLAQCAGNTITPVPVENNTNEQDVPKAVDVWKPGTKRKAGAKPLAQYASKKKNVGFYQRPKQTLKNVRSIIFIKLKNK